MKRYIIVMLVILVSLTQSSSAQFAIFQVGRSSATNFLLDGIGGFLLDGSSGKLIAQ